MFPYSSYTIHAQFHLQSQENISHRTLCYISPKKKNLCTLEVILKIYPPPPLYRFPYSEGKRHPDIHRSLNNRRPSIYAPLGAYSTRYRNARTAEPK